MEFFSSLLTALPGAVAQGIIWGLMALGVFVTFRMLDFADLTVDSSICTGGAVSVMLMLKFQEMGVNPLLGIVLAMLASFAAGMLAGACTGLLNTALGIPPILAGILTQLALYSVNLRIMGGKANQGLGMEAARAVTVRDNTGAIIVGGIFIICIIALLYWFFGTEIGCAMRATGNNRKMVRAQSVNTNTMKVWGLIISNGLVAMAGSLLAQYNGNADINMGRGAIVIGLASVIIGEVVFGRRRNFAARLVSIVLGSIIYYIVINIVLQLGWNTNDLKLLTAVLVAVALGIPYLRGKHARVKVAEVVSQSEKAFGAATIDTSTAEEKAARNAMMEDVAVSDKAAQEEE